MRELANVLERAQILAEGHLITTDDLPESVVESGPTTAGADEDPRHLRAVERRHVQEVLEQTNGNKVQAARTLGISRPRAVSPAGEVSFAEPNEDEAKPA